jgi:hypothetical protein
MGTQRGQMKGVLFWLVCWACRAVTRDFCSPLAAIVSLVQTNFFLTVHFFNSFVLISQQAEQAAVLGLLSLTVCLLLGFLQLQIRNSSKEPLLVLYTPVCLGQDFLFHPIQGVLFQQGGSGFACQVPRGAPDPW